MPRAPRAFAALSHQCHFDRSEAEWRNPARSLGFARDDDLVLVEDKVDMGGPGDERAGVQFLGDVAREFDDEEGARRRRVRAQSPAGLMKVDYIGHESPPFIRAGPTAQTDESSSAISWREVFGLAEINAEMRLDGLLLFRGEFP